MADENSKFGSANLVPVDQRRLADQAYDSIRQAILSGAITGGERLVEVSVAEQLGMSRAPVREAFRRLGAEGLVDDVPRRGTFVRSFDPDQLADLYTLRLALEASAIRLCVRHGIDVAPLRSILAEQVAAVERNDPTSVSALGLDLHRRICELSRNAAMAEIFLSMQGQFMLAISLTDARTSHPTAVLEAHAALIDAIEARNEVVAVTAFVEHVMELVGETLDKLGGDRDRLLAPVLVVA